MNDIFIRDERRVMANDTKARMVAGAARLLAERGLQETSFAEVIELTGAPRGSIYHHFPAGKDELIAQAVDHAGARAVELLDSVAGAPADEVASAFLGMWRVLLVRADFRIGCSVLAVTVATDSPDLVARAATVFRAWRGRLAELLAEGGLTAESAGRVATLLVAAAEGAVVIARAERSIDPFDQVADELLQTVRAHVRPMDADADVRPGGRSQA